MSKSILVIVICCLFLTGLTSVAETIHDAASTHNPCSTLVSDADWWPTFHHDLRHTGYSTSTAPFTNKTQWVYQTGGMITGSPVIANGFLYIGSRNSFFYCLNAEDGQMVWTFDAAGDIRGSPAVANGNVIFASDYQLYFARVYCLNATTAEEVWTYDISDGVHTSLVFGAPTVCDGRVYIGSDYFTLCCLDERGNGDGTTDLLWSYQTGNSVESTPSVVDGKVYFTSDKLYCLDASDGSNVWNFSLTEECTVSSPTVIDGRLYVGSRDNNIYCFDADPSDGVDEGIADPAGATYDQIWVHQTRGWIVSSPAVAYGKLYIGALGEWEDPPSPWGTVYCLNASDGSYCWSFNQSDGWYASSPAVADGKVFIGANWDPGVVYCLNAFTGKQIWNYTTGSWVYSSPAVAAGKVTMCSSNGKVYCFYDNETSPELEIEMKGGLFLKTVIKNTGTADVNNVEYTISVSGGMLHGIHAGNASVIPMLESGMSRLVTLPVFGFGRVTINCTVSAPAIPLVTKTADGFVLGFFVIVSKER